MDEDSEDSLGPRESCGAQLARLRERAGLSAAALAGRAETTEKVIGEIEAGRVRPSWLLAAGLAAALGVEIAELCAGPRMGDPLPPTESGAHSDAWVLEQLARAPKRMAPGAAERTSALLFGDDARRAP